MKIHTCISELGYISKVMNGSELHKKKLLLIKLSFEMIDLKYEK
jgi:hypothetical protein